MKKINNFALNPDEDTLQQFKHCYEQEFVSKAALMPDAHKGYVAPIGAVLVTKDYVVPSWVGFDIGCGVIAVEIKGKNLLEKIKENENKIFDSVKARVPMGVGEINEKKNISDGTLAEYEKLLNEFKKKPHRKEVLQFLEGKAVQHLGTVGSGNHFIELGYSEEVLSSSSEDGTGLAADLSAVWVVIHSGSRGVGYKVAEFYMKQSAKGDKEFEKTYPIHKDSDTGKEYLNILDFSLEFALLNRMEMARKVILSLEEVLGEKIEWELWVNKNHNHAVPDDGYFIHRKGATPAKKGERGVIPGNMRDGSFLVEGLGNAEFLNSSSHGAGRKYSRTQAQKEFSMKEFEKSMKGIKGTVSEGTIDEAPMAYKDIYEVMDAQKESVKIVTQIKPLINWKGEKRRSKKK
ncbi:MAG: RNA-splicing ligase RtcB [Candidatus Diapherotrites archaeon]|uniref:tRNA-splicing ligase RtcB n=1 Tax=Candidatus Iainarchaeum sp. TaxID=3101447 RepID=A0A2D6LPD6_9ARCH|nr:RNA-splicing ligase RtcB [Candidatus Diapherotrites archaeon]|tara:strand:- start:1444 stop:2655 length:1212 start_codon:yes stop_codon:yes gene_type:complete